MQVFDNLQNSMNGFQVEERNEGIKSISSIGKFQYHWKVMSDENHSNHMHC